ncbi:MAG: DoxX family protein, partial [Dysgonamonadaceae bacterium]|nr:DoxX family protein [Dysgonamonadaceae bacterium]
MEIPEDAEPPVFNTKLIYAKNGVQREFTIEDYPKEDSTWTFVTSKVITVKKGYEPPIHDFSITTEDGNDITDNVLSDPNYTFLLIAHKLEEAEDDNVEKINDIYDYARKFGYQFYALTSSLPVNMREWAKSTGAEYPFCTMDDIALKTIIRSNPGLLLLKNGTVINKWPNRALPILSETITPLDNNNIGQIPENRDRRNIFIISIILLIP